MEPRRATHANLDVCARRRVAHEIECRSKTNRKGFEVCRVVSDAVYPVHSTRSVHGHSAHAHEHVTGQDVITSRRSRGRSGGRGTDTRQPSAKHTARRDRSTRDRSLYYLRNRRSLASELRCSRSECGLSERRAHAAHATSADQPVHEVLTTTGGAVSLPSVSAQPHRLARDTNARDPAPRPRRMRTLPPTIALAQEPAGSLTTHTRHAAPPRSAH